jgi:hypothetical protein
MSLRGRADADAKVEAQRGACTIRVEARINAA